MLRQETALPDWLSPASAFVVTSVLASMFGGHLRVLRDKPRDGLEMLAAAHAAQAGALLIVTVALAARRLGRGGVVVGDGRRARSSRGGGSVRGRWMCTAWCFCASPPCGW
ncbi:MAG: hypothetical protein HND58_16710 [Planctomycetota bacterium]|nr:MAG: hypothetical protein HND58_16710 [Planctomycetota bacterium]